MFRSFLAALALVSLAACGQDARRIDEAERAVPDFHLALIDGDFAGIYQRAAPELQQQETAEAFVARLQTQRKALGSIRGTERSSAKVEGERVTLSYNTFYEAQQASEEFVILAPAGQPPRLAGYRLLSPKLD
ncbi:hypothetical protein ACFONG_15385 [Uliginosibacterium paludis]|jgi:hypothetical protein|uniref:DUF3887 domain-containing protein n=1 Tax=Uliginosibacterium paludis TaxID=1615952 RepID=A0ABV2CTM6_9RHOO